MYVGPYCFIQRDDVCVGSGYYTSQVPVFWYAAPGEQHTGAADNTFIQRHFSGGYTHQGGSVLTVVPLILSK